jgi:HlyD family secretion protein
MPSKVPRKTVLVFGPIAIVAVLLLLTRGSETPVTVSTVHPVRQNLTSWISSNGKVEPIEPYVVQSPLTTFIETVSVKQGDVVRRGQVLLTLDARDLEGDLARARSELYAAEDERRIAAAGGPPDELAQLQSDLAKTEIEIARLREESARLERLYAKQAATRLELEQNRLALQKAEADKRLIEQKKSGLAERAKVQAEGAALRAEQARQTIRSIQEKLSSARVTAPVDATVYSLTARTGTFVHTGDPLAEIADLGRIRVRAFVDEPELGLLKEGQPVEITWDGLPGRTWAGRIEQLPNAIVARGSRNVGEVLCSVGDANSELLPNTNVDVRVRTSERANTLIVPRGAVRTDGSTHYVFVVQQGRLQRRDVVLGVSNSTHYEILSGLTDTDVVALPGASEPRNGLPVNVS